MDDWERRTNSHGYTYYYHVSTGVLREVWQSHVEIGQYVARSTRILLEAVTPPLRQLLLAQPAISQQPPPSIPVTFIPAKQSSSVVYTANNIDDDIRDEIRPELPV
ncbi:hypothetical protein DYB31_011984 [Aphanomyces astaci]|uniref:Uncharacterized protein n=1 Tax=Aphanomyces astaci TaxID=112090 RepID=A0A397F9R7_APHAT|nr:hypothetical protein DYB31_011984 [Aphanomyces astaci]